MENVPTWVMLAGVLIAALLMYAVAWRIVQGTHIVVRVITRVLLGALIVIPAILYLLYGENGAMQEPGAARAPMQQGEPAAAAKPKKKVATAPPAKQEMETGARAPEKSDKAMEDENSRAAERSPAEETRHAEESERQAAEADARRRVEEELARSKATEATPVEPAPDGTEVAAVEPAPATAEEATEEAAPSDEESASPGASGTTPRRRYYRRSYSTSPPASTGGSAYESRTGDAGSGQGGGGASGEIGIGSYGTDGSSGSAPGGVMPSLPSPALDGSGLPSVEPPVVPEPEAVVVETPAEAAPAEPLPEMAETPDVSAPPGDNGTGAAAAPSPTAPPVPTSPPDSTAAEVVKEDWSIVPVYYGTDRARADQEKRIGYDWQRGGRVELGLAMVTIPHEHVVPMVERPWALKIPYVDIILYEAAEDPKKHFTMKELKALTKEEFLKVVKERLAKSARFKDHALVFIHGYKTTFDNAVYRTAQIAYDLKFDGAPFLYSWPSGGTLQGYTYDRESAAQSEIYLRQFLEMVRDETGAKKVSIIAHSMGNQLLLRTLQDMKRSMPEGVLISQLILAAPDVDRDSFQHIVKSIEGIAEGITLYAAANDTALAFSRQVNGGVPRAGDVPESGPIVMEGIDTIDATATSMDSVGINHSGYAENNSLLEDIGKLVSAGVRPPGVRQPTLERVETDKGAYWRYPAPP